MVQMVCHVPYQSLLVLVSIEHLIQYYSYSANGLPYALTVTISPSKYRTFNTILQL